MRRVTAKSRPPRAALPVTGLACLTVAAALTLGPPASPGTGAGAAEAASGRPNVVVVMTDDQTVDDLRVMSRTRRLIGRRGVTFRNSFVSYPLCCPSRATFFSGQYAHNHKVMGLAPPTGGYARFAKRNALPVWLERAGYRTAHVGKYLNGYGTQTEAHVPPGWSEWYGTVDPSTYRMWGYTLNENGAMNTYGDAEASSPDPALYQTDVLTDRAAGFIRRRADRRSPFFLSVSYLAPHHEKDVRNRERVIVRPAPRHRGAHASAALPRPPSFDEADLSDKPRYVQRRSPRLTEDDIGRITANYRARQESLLAVDEGVGRIVRALRRSGQLPNTYLLFTSDNGFLQGEHRVRSGKVLPYEPSIRVPLLMAGPGIARGGRSRELVGNIDLAPTILDLAGARPGKRQDGRSLMPFARRPGLRSRRLLLNETGGLKPGRVEPDQGPVAPLRNILTYTAVRTPRYMYVQYRRGSRELYDLRRDPHQLRSLHDAPRYRRVRVALARELRRLRDCRGRSCRRAGRPIPPPAPRVDPGLGGPPQQAPQQSPPPRPQPEQPPAEEPPPEQPPSDEEPPTDGWLPAEQRARWG